LGDGLSLHLKIGRYVTIGRIQIRMTKPVTKCKANNGASLVLMSLGASAALASMGEDLVELEVRAPAQRGQHQRIAEQQASRDNRRPVHHSAGPGCGGSLLMTS
jgi:hypothetical protein